MHGHEPVAPKLMYDEDAGPGLAHHPTAAAWERAPACRTLRRRL